MKNVRKLSNQFVGHLYRNIAFSTVFLGLYFVVSVISSFVNSVTEEALAPTSGALLILNEALTTVNYGLIWVGHASLVIFFLMMGLQILGILMAKVEKINVIKSANMSRILQRSLVYPIDEIEDSSNELVFSMLKTSQRFQKKLNKLVKNSFVILGKENYIVIPLPIEVSYQKRLISSANDAASLIAGFTNKKVAAQKKISFANSLYLYYSLS